MIISWNTTNQCNLSCAHCYRDAGCRLEEELSTDEAKKMIDEISKAGFKIMIFSGGEPLMRHDIFELIEYAKNTGLRPVLGTNGILINKEVAGRLKDLGVMGVGISLDSLDPKKHNCFRGYENSFELAIEGMKRCREIGLPFQLHTTVMDWNIDEVCDMTDFAVEIGAVAHHIFFLIPVGRGEFIENTAIGVKEYEELLVKIMKKQETVPIEIKPTCAPQFTRIAEQIGVKTRFNKGCIAGISYCIISPIGKVQPCAYMNIEVGDVRLTPFNIIWKENEILNNLRTQQYSGSCQNCTYKEKCGGCRARAAFYNNGDYMHEDTYCAYSMGIKNDR